MKTKLANELVDEMVESSEVGDLIYLKKAVKYVTDRMELSHKICEHLFDKSKVSIEDVYTMFDYISKETNMQYATAIAQKAGLGGGLSSLPPLTDDEIN